MIKLNFIYSEEKDVERVFYIINKWDFYQQYYNFDWIKLPIKLDKLKIKDYSKTEVIESVKEEFLNNSINIYKKVEQEIIEEWQSVSEKIENVFSEKNMTFPNELKIQLTCYGMGGGYWLPNEITLMATKFNLPTTIVHELIHLIIEGWIYEYNIDQPKKERIVDLFMSKYFGVLFPDRLIPKWSQQIYQKINYQEIDEVFYKFEPDMEKVIMEVSKLNL